MGLFSIVGSIFGSKGLKKGSTRAENAQLEGIRLGIDETRRQYDQNRADYAPYLQAGTAGLGQLGDLIGTNGPEAQSAALAALQGSPELASIVRNGEEAILANASATGGLRGGNIQGALRDFRGDSFASLIGQQIQRLGGLAGLGQGATDSVSALGTNAANNLTNLYGQQGATRAQGILTRAGINAQNWNNVGQFADGLVSSFAGGGGRGGLGGIFRSLFG